MEDSTVKRLGLILSIQAEIESMKLFNLERKISGLSPFYGEKEFMFKAKELRAIVNKIF
jgi:hypothetical protein